MSVRISSCALCKIGVIGIALRVFRTRQCFSPALRVRSEKRNAERRGSDHGRCEGDTGGSKALACEEQCRSRTANSFVPGRAAGSSASID